LANCRVQRASLPLPPPKGCRRRSRSVGTSAIASAATSSTTATTAGTNVSENGSLPRNSPQCSPKPQMTTAIA
jgi:hypothetical protein